MLTSVSRSHRGGGAGTPGSALRGGSFATLGEWLASIRLERCLTALQELGASSVEDVAHLEYGDLDDIDGLKKLEKRRFWKAVQRLKEEVEA